jgi:transcriptional regulator with XRE-family HTH domain
LTDVADLHEVLAAAIAAERRRRGLTQAGLGSLIGWPQSSVSKVERGVRAVLAADLPALCDALDVTLEQLLRDADMADLRALGLG